MTEKNTLVEVSAKLSPSPNFVKLKLKIRTLK